MNNLDALAEKYREHWGMFDDDPPQHGSGRAVVCLSYPELPPFPSLGAAAEWACVDKSHLWRAIRDGSTAAGCRWAYVDNGVRRGRGGRKGKPVRDDRGNVFPSASAAAKAVGVRPAAISKAINGWQTTAAGRKWRFVDG